MPTFRYDMRPHLDSWLQLTEARLSEIERIIQEELGFRQAPAELAAIRGQLDALFDCVRGNGPGNPGLIDVEDALAPLLKTVVIYARRMRAVELEGPRQRTLNHDLLDVLDEELAPLDSVIGQPWMHQTAAARLPELSDFLTVERTDARLAALNVRLPERQYDEKFHVLQAPSLFVKDLQYYRTMCGARKRSVLVAYLDIDNFKAFNTRYGESTIDRSVLPEFMKTVEAFVFSRGQAYRYGGDEYMLLLPSVSYGAAAEILDELRRQVQDIHYRGVAEPTTISVGACVVHNACFLTDREAEERANRAKNYAKQHGKNCIATYEGELFRDEDIRIVAPRERLLAAPATRGGIVDGAALPPPRTVAPVPAVARPLVAPTPASERPRVADRVRQGAGQDGPTAPRWPH
jgi:diguanylate cyclase (GGDEF)-like protein